MARAASPNLGTNGAPGQGLAPNTGDAVTLYDARIGYTLDNWEFSLNGKNLADKTYISWCRSLNNDCGYGDLRSVVGDVRYHF